MSTIKQAKLMFGFWVKKYCLDKKKEPIESSNIQDVNKILFVRHDGKFGDCVVSSFMYRELKKNNPNLQIDVIATENIKSFLEKNRYIDHIHLVKARKLREFIKLGKRLAKQHYDVVVDVTERIRNRDVILLNLINAKINIGYDKAALKLFNITIPKNDLHASETYKAVLQKLNCKNIETHYDVPYDENAAKKVAHFLQSQVKSKYIAINFFGASNKRIFTQENINKILFSLQRDLKDSATKVVLLTYPAVTLMLKKCLSNELFDKKMFYIYEDSQTMFDSIELIRECELLISVDTSVIHIATGLNKKMIVVMNQENLKKWHPNSSQEYQIIPYKQNVNDAAILFKPDFSFIHHEK